MEDLIISPWQNQENQNKSNLDSLFNKVQLYHHDNAILKNRHMMTQQNDIHDSSRSNKKFHIQIIRKKNQSLSSSQNTQQRKRCAIPKKLQIKLLSYPTTQKQKQRLIKARYSQKIQTSPQTIFQNPSFEVIQTIYNADLNNFKIFKQRSLKKHQTFHQQVQKMKKVTKYDPFQSKSLQKLNPYEKRHQKQLCINAENHLKMFDLNLDLIKFSSKQGSKKNLNHHYHLKSVQRPKLRIQKIQNINIFKENKQINTTLKKKNKNSFNQLEKYNLFGLKKLKKKQPTFN